MKKSPERTKFCVLDIETTGLYRYTHSINYIGLGIVTDGNTMSRKIILNMYENRDLAKFKRIVKKLKDGQYSMIYQNGKFDTLFVEEHTGIRLPMGDDVMLMGTAFDLTAEHGLDKMAWNYLKIPNWDIPLKEKTKPNNPLVENEYLPKDIETPWLLYKFFCKRLDDKQWRVYHEVLQKAYKGYRNIERNGIYIDLSQLEKVKTQYKSAETKAKTRIPAINWNSPKQVAKLLYEDMELPVLSVTKTGAPSSDAKTLRRLAADGHEIAKNVLEYKFYLGARTKFLDVWPKYADKNSRIHPSFKLTNVVTGRTSCSDPNLQQVPRNKELRTLFTAPPGGALIEADYSQIELRLAAHYSQDPTMLAIYKNGGDIHTETGMAVSGHSYDEVKANVNEYRTKAKAVNFGFVYGMQARGFVAYARDSYGAHVTPEEATIFRDKFFGKYNRLLDWHNEQAFKCELDGGIYNSFGQFRALPDIWAQNKWERAAAIRRAINTPVQGDASILLMMAAYQIDRDLTKEFNIAVNGTIHDAVLVTCFDEKDAPQVSKEIQRIMARPEVLDIFDIEFSVPIVADVGIGPWGAK